MNLDALDSSILGPALLAGLIVLSTHVPLGRRVLERGIIFIDLAIAQVAGLGVIAASLWFDSDTGWAVQVSAFAAALIGALLLHQAERLWPNELEAIIGSVFVLSATASLLLLSGNPHGGEKLSDLLSGQVLWVTSEQLWPAALISVPLAWILITSNKRIDGLLFYLIFALAITTSVQLVGVYLVFASLILPALFTKHLRQNQPQWALAIGISGYASGLILSALFNLPTSPLIVWTMATWGVVSTVLLGRKEHKSQIVH